MGRNKKHTPTAKKGSGATKLSMIPSSGAITRSMKPVDEVLHEAVSDIDHDDAALVHTDGSMEGGHGKDNSSSLMKVASTEPECIDAGEQEMLGKLLPSGCKATVGDPDHFSVYEIHSMGLVDSTKSERIDVGEHETLGPMLPGGSNVMVGDMDNIVVYEINSMGLVLQGLRSNPYLVIGDQRQSHAPSSPWKALFESNETLEKGLGLSFISPVFQDGECVASLDVDKVKHISDV